MLKRTIALITAAAMLTLFSGCTQEPSPAAQEINVAVSFYPLYIAAMNITDGVESVKLTLIAPPETGCPHDYQLKPSDMQTLESAALLIVNGAGLEPFLSDVAARYPELAVCTATEKVTLLESHHAHSHEGEHEDGEEEIAYNPHAWVNVANYILYVRAIADALCLADPGNMQSYRRNEDHYIVKLTDLQAEMQLAAAQLKSRRLVTFHEAFDYLADELGLEIAAVLAADPDIAPSPGEVAEVVEIVRADGITAIFTEPGYTTGAVETVARETGAQVYILNPVTSGELALDAYRDIQRENMRVLQEALG